MSEGELKKRIAVVISGKATKTGIWYNNDVFKVLDEAKKELEECIFYFDPDDAIGYYMFDQEELEKWAIKWLGKLKHAIY